MGVLSQFCEEGDNIVDACQLASYLNSWLNLIDSTTVSACTDPCRLLLQILLALCIVPTLVVLLTCVFIVCRTVVTQAASGAFHYLGVYCMATVLIGLCMIKFCSYVYSVDL